MLPKLAAGCLVIRETPDGREVLLVHPAGASYQQPRFGIPKGLIEEHEDPQRAALRETLEETGLRVRVIGDLGTVQQKNRKIVHAYLATVDPESLTKVDAVGRCPHGDDENDVCRFYPINKARAMMIEAQREFLDRLEDLPRG